MRWHMEEFLGDVRTDEQAEALQADAKRILEKAFPETDVASDVVATLLIAAVSLAENRFLEWDLNKAVEKLRQRGYLLDIDFDVETEFYMSAE